ncbi:MAG: amidohydrolase family protein [Rhodospirillaceae bacterium]
MKTPMLSTLLMGVAVLLFSASGAMAQERPLVIQGGTLIDGTGRPPIKDSVIVVEGSRIKQAGRRDAVVVPPGAQIMDATGKTILPGLIDMHFHLRGWKIPMYLRYGVTTAGDIHNDTLWSLGQRALLKSGMMQGPHLFISGARVEGPNGPKITDIDGNPVDDPSYVTTPEEARAYIRYLHTIGVDHIKVDSTITDDQLNAVIDEARKYHMPVLGHLNNIDIAMGFGMNEVEHLQSIYRAQLIRDGKPMPAKGQPLESVVDPAHFGPLIRKMVDQGVIVDIALYNVILPSIWNEVQPEIMALANDPQLAFAPPEEKALWVKPPKENKLSYETTTSFVRQYAAAGGKLITGSSDGQQNTNIMAGLSIHLIMQGAVKMGLTPMQAIMGATLYPAQVLGIEKDYGSVEVGKSADFVVLDGDPLADIRNTKKIRTVIQDGKVMDTKYDPKWKNPLGRNKGIMFP